MGLCTHISQYLHWPNSICIGTTLRPKYYLGTWTLRVDRLGCVQFFTLGLGIGLHRHVWGLGFGYTVGVW